MHTLHTFNKNYFFRENYSYSIINREYQENIITTDYIKTKLSSHYLFASKLVMGVNYVAHPPSNLLIPKGSLICEFNYLDIPYHLVMEKDGYLVKSYIQDLQVIGYNQPLFLIKEYPF